MNGGDVIFKFKGDTSDIKKTTSKLGSTLKSAAATAGKAFASLSVVAGTALVGIASKAVQMRGEVEQQIGGTEAVFKQFAGTVQDNAAKAFDQMGVSANTYMQYINKMGSLMQGSGISIQKSMDLSAKAMQRASDVASIMGISVDDAMTAISGAAKGNFTMMDNLGVAMNATSLSAYALSKGIKKTYQQMSQAEKVELAMQMFLEKSAYAAGNYAKENKTLAGSLTTLKAAAQNLLAGTGGVEQVISALKNFGIILVSQLKTLLPEIVKGLVELVNGILPLLPDIIKTLLPVLIDGVVALTLGIIDVLPDLIMMIADILPDLINQLTNALINVIIPRLISMTPQFVKAGWQLLKALIKGMWDMRFQVWTGLVKLGSEAIVRLKKLFTSGEILTIGKNLVKGLWNGIKNAKDWVLEKIKGFGKAVLKGIKKIFGISSPSKEFAIIGRYNVMGLEEGMRKESLKLQDTFDGMFDLSPNLYGSSSTNLSPTINVVNNINMKQDSLGQMVNDIKTFSGGAKNDYSYGMGA